MTRKVLCKAGTFMTFFIQPFSQSFSGLGYYEMSRAPFRFLRMLLPSGNSRVSVTLNSLIRALFRRGFFPRALSQGLLPCAISRRLFLCTLSQGLFPWPLLPGLFPCTLLKGLFPSAVSQGLFRCAHSNWSFDSSHRLNELICQMPPF